jgi:protein SCO1/2
MPRALKVVVVVALASFALSAWALVHLVRSGDGRSRDRQDVSTVTRPPRSLMFIPEFSLVDQDGNTVTRADLLGRVTVMDFIFTHCPFVCPILTEKMSEAAAALKGTPVQFISVSVDPERDTPAALREYAMLHEADTKRWRFLTGDRAQVDAIVKDGLKFALVEDPNTPINLPGGGVMSNIVHPSWLILVGPDGDVFSFYRASDDDHMKQLLVDARDLLRQNR